MHTFSFTFCPWHTEQDLKKERKTHNLWLWLRECVPQNVTGSGSIKREYTVKGQGEHRGKSRNMKLNHHHYFGSLLFHFPSSSSQCYGKNTSFFVLAESPVIVLSFNPLPAMTSLFSCFLYCPFVLSLPVVVLSFIYSLIT